MTVTASLIFSLLPQAFPGGDITLPPRTTAAAAKDTLVRPLTEIERFRRDLLEMQGPPARVDLKLHEMAGAYAPAAMESLILEVARSARANEMTNLMLVARRFGGSSPRVGDELLFQLLARPLAEATRPVVETMAALKGDGRKAALRECIRGRIAGVRRHAAEVLIPLLQPEDLAFAIELSRDQSLDLQMRGIDLLQAMPGDVAAARLCDLLSKDAALAGAACNALVGMGMPAVAAMQSLAKAPVVDRGSAYAAFALARIAEHGDAKVLPDEFAAPLLARASDPEVLTRSLVAIALADLSHRGVAALQGKDATIVDALLDVVQPTAFVPNLDLLRKPAEDRLVRTTGRLAAAGEALSWRDWWKDQREGFAAVRAQLRVTDQDVGHAVVSFRHEGRHVRLLAEGLADVQPLAGATEAVLTRAEMLDLVNALQVGGFGDEAAMRVDSALPRQRSLAVQVPSGRAQVTMPLADHPRFDALVALVQARLDDHVWQLFRNPKTEPDRAAFWRAETAWREAHPAALDRGRRFFARAIAVWPSVSNPLRARAVDFVARHPDHKTLLGESDGEAALAMLAALPQLGEVDLRLLELAATVPGDRVWRQAVDLATRQKDGGRAAVRSVFTMLGSDAVLAALRDDNPVVRRAGIYEVMVVRDTRAAGRLVELLADADAEVCLAAAQAVGHLQVTAAQKPLIDRIVAEASDPILRRECLRSLGRVGGDMAFSVLQRALLSKSQDDKDAAMRGLGELDDPRAAHVLADLVVVGYGKDLGTLARLHLQRQAGVRAIPALRGQLQVVQDPVIRAELVLLLGAWHDAGAVPELMDLLRDPRRAPMAAAYLEGATGLSFAAAQDRIDMVEAWYPKNRTAPQWQWLLDALQTDKVQTSLRAEQFVAGAASPAVPELVRLLVEAPDGRLWALTAAVLRGLTGEDFGAISAQSPQEAREAVAARYRIAFDTQKAIVR